MSATTITAAQLDTLSKGGRVVGTNNIWLVGPGGQGEASDIRLARDDIAQLKQSETVTVNDCTITVAR